MNTQHVCLLLSSHGDHLFQEYVQLAKDKFAKEYPDAEKPFLKPSTTEVRDDCVLRSWFWMPCDTRDFQAWLINGLGLNLPYEHFKVIIVGEDINNNQEFGSFDNGETKIEFKRMTLINGRENTVAGLTPQEANLMASALLYHLWSLRKVSSDFGDFMGDDHMYMVEKPELKTMLSGLKKLRTLAGPAIVEARMDT